jgi:hypothetical protein
MKQDTKTARADLLSIISSAFPSQFNLDRDTAAKFLCISAGHLSNMDCVNRPILPSRKIGAKVVYQITDIINFQLGLREEAPKLGRRTKADVMAAREAEGGLHD